jgi:hypothetical protein
VPVKTGTVSGRMYRAGWLQGTIGVGIEGVEAVPSSRVVRWSGDRAKA